MGDMEKATPSGEEGRVPAVLRGKNAREVLAALLCDDTLELSARCLARLRDQAVILPHQRLYLRTAARMAHAASTYRGAPPLDVWIAKCISISARQLLESEREWAHHGLGDDEPGADFHASLASVLGMEPQMLRRGCVRFNGQAYEVRRAFWDLVIEGRSLEQAAETDKVDRTILERRLQRAASALGIEPPQRPADPMGGDRDK